MRCVPSFLSSPLRVALRWLALLAALCGSASVAAQGVELLALRALKGDGELTLDYHARLALTPAIEDALKRGVPLYFVAQAAVYRNRWYWRDERVARVSRSWRVAYQPLTNTWRVGLGGLHQTHETLAEALSTASRSAGWKLAELSQIDPGSSYTIEFSYRLDTKQLPSPMQFGLGGPGGEWSVGVERVLKFEPQS